MESDKESQQKAINAAVGMQSSLDQTVKDVADTQELVAKLDRLARELFDLATDWEGVDPEMAERVRSQEQNIHELRSRTIRAGEMETDEAQRMIVEIRRLLRRATGG